MIYLADSHVVCETVCHFPPHLCDGVHASSNDENGDGCFLLQSH